MQITKNLVFNLRFEKTMQFLHGFLSCFYKTLKKTKKLHKYGNFLKLVERVIFS